ncbi:unnamed protein product [Brassica oleracea var. botrytis]|uniref:Secreted protein n=3 Tax=Brassica TaxID=3705 RepID=A0A8X7P7H0_BRACI|nr:hypothetical protein Bca52824_087087 [Brassica carinata]CAF2074925.1 unnamed protein product [Brassica napus]CDY17546.1 BnaC01g26700D [Brassica napus]VDD51024.1 unnamed protein product [Brassica oleracea]
MRLRMRLSLLRRLRLCLIVATTIPPKIEGYSGADLFFSVSTPAWESSVPWKEEIHTGKERASSAVAIRKSMGQEDFMGRLNCLGYNTARAITKSVITN